MTSLTTTLTDMARVEIDALRRRQEEIYLKSPKELISHSNQERQTKRDYRGREILELLQNADDAADEAGVPGRLLFRLSPDKLIVANTGAVFTFDGIESVVVSHASPKQFSRQRHIGNKGLGFRSVLNWTERPLIRSGPYAVTFSPEFAQQRIEDLTAASDSLRERWRDLERSRGPRAVPLLRFPHVPDEIDADLQLAERVLAEGYDTVLVFPFLETDEHTEPYEALGEQLDELGPEVLLFCRQLAHVIFEKEGEETKSWEVVREVGAPVLPNTMLRRVCLSRAAQTQLWTVHSRAESLPSDLARLAPDTPDYEVAVAVPDDSQAATDHRLCVFFPTEERVPSVCLLHATLLLEANRKHPVADDAINGFVLEALAWLWVEVARQQTVEAPANGLALLEGADRISGGLLDLGFRDHVLEKTREAALFPRLDGKCVDACNAVRPPTGGWADLLAPGWSPEALNADAEEVAPGLLRALGIGWYSGDDLRTRLERWSASLAPAAAGRVFGRALAMNALPEGPAALLRLETGGVADMSLTTYLPKEGASLELPSWVTDFAFLSADFVEAAREAAGLKTLRVLVDRLDSAGYTVREFNAAGVTRHLVHALQALPSDSGITPADATRDVLRTLMPLVEAEPDGGDISVAVPVITESGRIVPARDCYLGPSYSRGVVLKGMYGPLGKDEFVAPPQELGLAADVVRAEAFLVRLGAADRPRRVKVESSYQTGDGEGYQRFVLESLGYPYQAEDVAIASAEQALEEVHLQFQNLTMPDRWPDVLERGSPDAVLAYLAADGEHHLSIGGLPGAVLGIRKHHQRNARYRYDVRFPSPALFLLRSRRWIPSSDGIRRRPAEVAVSASVRRHLAGFLGEPVFATDGPFLRPLAARDLVRDVLSRLGAFRSFADLDVHSRFDLLRSLPHNDPNGRHAPSIYGALLEEHAATTESEIVQGFAADGVMWGRRGEVEEYFPVRSLRYATEAAIPGPVKRQVPLVAISPRKNAADVEALFGVRKLSREDYRIAVDETLTVDKPWSEEAERWFRAFVPVLYGYRLSVRADDSRERRRFSDVRVRVCESLACTVQVGVDVASDLMSEPYTAMAVQDTLFVVSPQPNFAPDPLFCDALSEALADHLGVPGEASSLAGFLLCPSPAVAVSLLDRRTAGRGRALYERAIAQLEWGEEVPEPIPLPEPTPEPTEEQRGQLDEPSEGAGGPTNEETPQERQGGGDFVSGEAPTRQHRNRVAWRQHTPADRKNAPRTIAQESVTLQVAEEFELQAGRFPLRVHNVVGARGFGCDLISFESEQDREDAKNAGAVDPTRIARFIEVKGRSSRLGAVELTENEQKAAHERGDRFFLYRVFISGAGTVELAILGAPATSEAFRMVTRYEYLLVVSQRTEWFVRNAVAE
jgi:hypothetical protein